MNKLIIGGTWIVSLLLAYYFGLSAAPSYATKQAEINVINQNTLDKNSVGGLDLTNAAAPSTQTDVAITSKSTQESKAATLSSEDIERQQQQQRLTLDTFLDVMLHQRQAKSHQEARTVFQEEYDEQAQDYERKTQVTDFLQLHEQAEQIMLHELKCEPTRCLLVGSFDGQHENWANIVEQMKEQDWWDFGGTSSSSNSDGAVTHFMLFMDKPN